ncbi:flagellar trans-acting factor FliX [Sphingomonas ginkgonis]|uniref:Flagellar trans-acting factor FliX n=1 Tax=Sphingomonas ginkgonis TaxID=2315330 RepID=A0A429VA32_9SPHN|nr:flagellar assembly protein FliX [Sphingomonas ginkgonis]RST30712.1 flagellar trans-acting factor FliX [Sphingomonas ginkgonis]
MQVDAVTALLQSALLAPAEKPDARPASFAQPAPPVPPAAQPGQVGGIAPSVAMLVTLAATDAGTPGRGAGPREAERGLDGLDALRRALVHGSVPPERIRMLRDWARGRRRSDDPDLAALEQEIELRILVELAKLERRPPG